jgi:hypothetical protein
MTREVPSLSGKVFTNKTRQGVWITRMEEGLVPMEHNMELISHRFAKAYKKKNSC